MTKGSRRVERDPWAVARWVESPAGYATLAARPMTKSPAISIVTPHFNGGKWLRLCVASVADQEVAHEHIVQDAGSTDGTLEWLPTDARVQAHVEKDGGMYDAINRGYRRATAPLLAHLNCDEQYLPGTLARVVNFFAQHPEVDMLFGDVVIVNASGEYLCERRSLAPQIIHTWTASNLAFLTAGTFLRREVLDRHQLWFNSSYREAGDQDWALRIARSGVRTATLGEFVSVFTETGANLGLNAHTAVERQAFHGTAPLWARVLAPLALVHFRLRRWRAGHYHCHPHEYSIYPPANPERRATFAVTLPTYRWRRTEAPPAVTR